MVDVDMGMDVLVVVGITENQATVRIHTKTGIFLVE